MTEFELQISSVVSSYSTNCATTPAAQNGKVVLMKANIIAKFYFNLFY